MSDSTAIGVAKMAAAFTEQMRAYASPADQAIQAGIDECMKGVIKAQTSMDPNALKNPTGLGPGTGPRQERKPEPGDLSKALLDRRRVLGEVGGDESKASGGEGRSQAEACDRGSG
jgi:hypothetical protein